jgi:hypothetical protein
VVLLHQPVRSGKHAVHPYPRGRSDRNCPLWWPSGCRPDARGAAGDPFPAWAALRLLDIREAVISSASATGAVYLSDVAFQSSAVGSGGPSRLPQISIAGTTVNEGDGPGTATVTLTRPSSVPVVASVQAIAGTGGQIASDAEPVTIPARRRSVSVSVPVIGNTTPATTVDKFSKVFVVDPANAVVGQDFARIVVHGDDGTQVCRRRHRMLSYCLT